MNCVATDVEEEEEEEEGVFKEGVEGTPCFFEVSEFPFPRFLFLMKDLETKFVVLLRDLKEFFFVLPAELLASESAPPPCVGLWLSK
jgi:hypothetical protein